MKKGADGTIGSTVSNTLNFDYAIPVEIRAGATYGGVNSIMNRAGDRFVWEAIGTSADFSWVVNNADFPGGGGAATVSPDGKTLTIEAGDGLGSANQAQFYVSTNGTLRGINVSMETIATLSGVINAAQFSLRIPMLCDADGDGITNDFDLDSDNDGISDILEAGADDNDGDGRADVTTDTDGDGLVDTFDNDDADGPDVSGCTIGVDCDLSSSTSLLLDTNADGTNDKGCDIDSDGLACWIDTESDGDGCLDTQEAQVNDPDVDGIAGTGTATVDADGRVSGITYTTPANEFWKDVESKVSDCIPKAFVNPTIPIRN